MATVESREQPGITHLKATGDHAAQGSIVMDHAFIGIGCAAGGEACRSHVGPQRVAARRKDRRDLKTAIHRDGALPFRFRGPARVRAFQTVEAREAAHRVGILRRTADAREVRGQRELAAIDRIRQEVTIVNDRMNDRLLTFLELGIIRVLNVEVITAGVEAVTFASACQINLIGLDVVLVAFQAVGTRKIVIRLHHGVPAEGPARVDAEIALAGNHAALIVQRVTRSGNERIRGLLADAGDRQRVHAGFETLAQLGLKKQALFCVVGRCDREVGRIGKNLEIGDTDTEAELVGHAHLREQESRLPLHRIVRHRQERDIGDRMAEKLQTCFFQPHRMGLAVLNDALGLYLPQRRLFRALGAGQTRGVDTVVEDHQVAFKALGAFPGNTGIVRGLDAQCVDEALTEVVGHVHLVGIDLVAARLDQLDVAMGDHATGLLVIFHLLGHHTVARIFHANHALRDDALGIAVIGQFICCKQEFRIVLACRRKQTILAESDRAGCQIRAHSGTCQKGRPKPPDIPAVNYRHLAVLLMKQNGCPQSQRHDDWNPDRDGGRDNTTTPECPYEHGYYIKHEAGNDSTQNHGARLGEAAEL